MGKKATTSGGYTLGKAIINARDNLPAAKRKKNKLDLLKRQKAGQEIDVNTVVVVDDQQNDQQTAMFSVTEQNDLDEFLTKAQLAGTQFTAERANVSIVNATAGGSNKLVGVAAKMNAEQKRLKLENCRQTYKDYLKIPRRPFWDSKTTADELKAAETEAFLIWRRKLAELEEVEQVVLTPFERNIEIWRQLWRVLERSKIVVQILDARDPLLFRNEDLESYVDELSDVERSKNSSQQSEQNSNKLHKMNVLLLNKADYLTEKQRQIWCRYFNQQNIRAVFWSAIDLNDEFSKVNRKKDSTIEEEVEDEDREIVDTENENIEKEINNLDIQEHDEFKDSLNKPNLMARDQLIEYLNNLRTHIYGLNDGEILTVGMVGYPNVGKSSTINKLLLRKKVAVSSTPGKTKHFQTLHLDQENLLLCDCPGLVMPSLAMSKEQMTLSGILSADQMRQHEPVIDLLCTKFSKRVFEIFYGLTLPKHEGGEQENSFVHTRDLLTSYAFVRGLMSPKGLPDCSRAARAIVKDFVAGRLLCRQAPPDVEQSAFDDSHRDWLKKPLIENEKDVGDEKKSKQAGAASASSQILKTLQKRHLLEDEGGVQGEIDRTFFGLNSISGPAHVVKASSRKPILITSDGKPPKKLNKNQKKDKLRRIYSHLDA
uniref:Large subunit GTPase 1 homolog n=1 Tax=Romanomermis culicivorax TaxID=13658 RepID=A0A915IRU3_ROMCU